MADFFFICKPFITQLADVPASVNTECKCMALAPLPHNLAKQKCQCIASRCDFIHHCPCALAFVKPRDQKGNQQAQICKDSSFQFWSLMYKCKSMEKQKITATISIQYIRCPFEREYLRDYLQVLSYASQRQFSTLKRGASKLLGSGYK